VVVTSTCAASLAAALGCLIALGAGEAHGPATAEKTHPASLHEEERCMDLWFQSNMTGWAEWKVRIDIRNGSCLLTLAHREGFGLYAFSCWETRWKAIQCAGHGGRLDPAALDHGRHWAGVIRNGRLVLNDSRARRISPPRSTKLPPLVDGYVQPFKNGRLRSKIHPARRFTGRCIVPGSRTSPGNYRFRCFFAHYVCDPMFDSRPIPKLGDLLYCGEAGSTRLDVMRFVGTA
jgi:hypothetical protein